jgi:hypothetical protein
LPSPYRATAQTSATTHPIKLQPRKKLTRKIARAFLCFLAIAIIVGIKYTRIPIMPINKKNMTRGALLFIPFWECRKRGMF